jgi:hypothetical protein
LTTLTTPPAAIDLHLDGEGFDSIDRSGQNTGKHGRIVGEGGRKGNAGFGCDDQFRSVSGDEDLPRHPKPLFTHKLLLERWAN